MLLDTSLPFEPSETQFEDPFIALPGYKGKSQGYFITLPSLA